MQITYAMLSEKGKRDYQEDSVCVEIQKKRALFVVADGLGGHVHGDLASKSVTECARKYFVENTYSEDFFLHCFATGNEALLNLQEEYKASRGFKSTVVCAVIEDGKLQGAYIGDSRLYVFQHGKIICQTADHSIPQMLASAGKIKENQIRRHPDRNCLLRVLGDRDRELKPQLTPVFPLDFETEILLCSDGFWEYILEKEMERALTKSSSAEEWLTRMQKTVVRRGFLRNMDNYTCICAKITG